MSGEFVLLSGEDESTLRIGVHPDLKRVIDQGADRNATWVGLYQGALIAACARIAAMPPTRAADPPRTWPERIEASLRERTEPPCAITRWNDEDAHGDDARRLARVPPEVAAQRLLRRPLGQWLMQTVKAPAGGDEDDEEDEQA